MRRRKNDHLLFENKPISTVYKLNNWLSFQNLLLLSWLPLKPTERLTPCLDVVIKHV